MSQRDQVRDIFKKLPTTATFEECLAACPSSLKGAVQFVWATRGPGPDGEASPQPLPGRGRRSAPGRETGSGTAGGGRGGVPDGSATGGGKDAPTTKGEAGGAGGGVPATVYVPTGGGRKKGLELGRVTRRVGVGLFWREVTIGDKTCEVGFSYVNDVVNWTVMANEDDMYKLFADELARYSDKELTKLLEEAK